ncbi:hypothetical protein BDN72DRAFT_57062 [Pluteus cervinus]|uniref:Uncharacterized protein n=1 Tax=Pluteus cervinus TaxID=181527 RepID=A0ACD3B8K7_9AGAR|nr:hypothetical protein BDN72DRAFT_57062 [Pluteus cervinus]
MNGGFSPPRIWVTPVHTGAILVVGCFRVVLYKFPLQPVGVFIRPKTTPRARVLKREARTRNSFSLSSRLRLTQSTTPIYISIARVLQAVPRASLSNSRSSWDLGPSKARVPRFTTPNGSQPGRRSQLDLTKWLVFVKTQLYQRISLDAHQLLQIAFVLCSGWPRQKKKAPPEIWDIVLASTLVFGLCHLQILCPSPVSEPSPWCAPANVVLTAVIILTCDGPLDSSRLLEAKISTSLV